MKLQFKSKISNEILLTIVYFNILFFASCANIVPPTGGPKDLTPPKLLSQSPADSVKGKKVNKIRLEFNKYVIVHDLQKQMKLSPLLPIAPTVVANGKFVDIKIIDSLLQPNTTYTIDLGNAIRDNRESTPFEHYIYTFSTGTYFDSLKIQGDVFSAETGLVDTGISIMLYEANSDDSAIVRQKPIYVGNVGKDGKFSIPNLPNRPFRLFAIKENEQNFIYNLDSEELLGFNKELITPNNAQDNTLKYSIPLFKNEVLEKVADTTKAPIQNIDNKQKFGNNRGSKNMKAAYTVNVDTFTKKGTAELNKPITIDLNDSSVTIDQDKIFLTYEKNNIEAQATVAIHKVKNTLKIETPWEADSKYTLRLIKGWAKDTAGVDLDPGKYIFYAKPTEAYASLNIMLDSQYVNTNHVLYIYTTTNDAIYLKPITTNSVNLTLLNPGTYKLRIIEDLNGNGKWDTGDWFKKRQAEKVIPHYTNIILKTGWENEVEFKSFDKENDKDSKFKPSK